MSSSGLSECLAYAKYNKWRISNEQVHTISERHSCKTYSNNYGVFNGSYKLTVAIFSALAKCRSTLTHLFSIHAFLPP